ncbi:MAG: hypothetical protein SWY16_26255 [Cyanobacteriota bacterium]|nr:hypothetical protein [Cyanobacteriota bacterium]
MLLSIAPQSGFAITSELNREKMKKYLFLASIALISSTSVASVSLRSLAAANPLNTTLDTRDELTHHHESHIKEGHGHDGHSEGHHDGMHHHGTMEIPDGQPVPEIGLVVSEDSVRGWNVEVQLKNFTLTPENVNQANRPGEGHAHLYINGEKMTRLYSNWYYLSELPPGEHTITVSLNSNQHDALTHNGQPIEASTILEVMP